MVERPTICLLVEHRTIEMTHSLYMIQPPLDLSDYDQMVDSEGFMADSKSPLLTFKKYKIMPNSASVNLGSRVYFLGGTHDYVEKLDIRLVYKVQFFDTDHPELGMQAAAPMNGPKNKCCVFVADDMIYALGTPVKIFKPHKKIPPNSNGSGYFERYDPSSDQWQILPDPPLPFREWLRGISTDCATVVGRRVFIGSPTLHAIFNLDTQDWDPLPPPELAAKFDCSSLFAQDNASLYKLRGPGSCKPGTVLYADVGVVKRGPLTTSKQGDYDYDTTSLLTSPCLCSDEVQLMAEASDLDGNTFFAHPNYFPWRDLFHMGGHFFCYVVTAQLLDHHDLTRRETKSRGVWINFLEEVPAQTQNGKKAKFRSLASFCYKIDTNFHNVSSYIRCSALGTVPKSWIEAPLKKKQVSKVRHRSKESEALHIQGLAVPTEQKDNEAEQRGYDVKNADYCEARDSDMKRLLAVQEEEIRRMAAELTRKNERLKEYEAMLAKTGCTVSH